MDFEENPNPPPSLTVDDLQETYTIEGDELNLSVTVGAEFGFDLIIEIYNQVNQPIVMVNADGAVSQSFDLIIQSPTAGNHSLVVKMYQDGEFVRQVSESFSLQLPPPPVDLRYDYIYPESKSLYTGGTRVLGTDGKVYECKPWPYQGWCSGSGTYYAPGTGLAWTDAWILIGELEDYTPPDPVAEHNYPDGLGTYENGTLVAATDGNIYRCLIGNWCNGSSLYYAPGTGLAWSQAWEFVSEQQVTLPSAPQFDYIYPDQRSSYRRDTVVQGTDGNLYRCTNARRCKRNSQRFAPGTGSRWQRAWSPID